MKGKVGNKEGNAVGDGVGDDVRDKVDDKVGDKGKTGEEGGNRLGGVHRGFPPTSPEARSELSKISLIMY